MTAEWEAVHDEGRRRLRTITASQRPFDLPPWSATIGLEFVGPLVMRSARRSSPTPPAFQHGAGPDQERAWGKFLRAATRFRWNRPSIARKPALATAPRPALVRGRKRQATVMIGAFWAGFGQVGAGDEREGKSERAGGMEKAGPGNGR